MCQSRSILPGDMGDARSSHYGAPLNLRPLQGCFGAAVDEFDCAELTPGTARTIRQALHEYELLIFRGQSHLTPRQEVNFYKQIDPEASTVWRDQRRNPWEVYKVEQGNLAGTYQIPGEPGVLVLGKGEINHYGLEVKLGGERGAYGEEDGSQVLGGGSLQWHIDGAFYGHEPCLYTQMSCIEAPRSGGHWLDYNDGTGARLWCDNGATAFASGRRALTLLPADARQRALRMVVHYLRHPFQTTYHLGNNDNGLRIVDPEAEKRYRVGGDDPTGELECDDQCKSYPLVWTCPVTGSQALMGHPRCMHHLEEKQAGTSRPLGVVESRLLLEDLMRPGIDPENVYVHPWRSGDLVIWHNRSVWHSATGGLLRHDRRVQHLIAFNGSIPPT